ncbi:HAMP domain-containing sensor histidine kinase [Pilimelia columellifera]|uniref:histidine kinase n=1 Tax=Pilimelia columellifera subsp. columellifera TaxID=706583 RepID=A0ABN3NJ48_9ACTN
MTDQRPAPRRGRLSAAGAGVAVGVLTSLAAFGWRRSHRPATTPPGDVDDDLRRRERDLDRARTEFMTTVSHELRTPLTNICGFLSMLRDPETGPLTSSQDHMLEVAERNANRLRSIVDDLLVLTRVEVGALHGSRQEVDYAWLISSAVAANASAAGAAGVTVHTGVAPGLTGRADPEQIDKLLANLLNNAVKFTPRGGRVDLTASLDGDRVVITVADTGIGVPPADQDALFTRFFRASNAVEKAIPGTGLGLPIVRAIVDEHGGEVRLTSTLGAGAAVTVRLPVDA